MCCRRRGRVRLGKTKTEEGKDEESEEGTHHPRRQALERVLVVVDLLVSTVKRSRNLALRRVLVGDAAQAQLALVEDVHERRVRRRAADGLVGRLGPVLRARLDVSSSRECVSSSRRSGQTHLDRDRDPVEGEREADECSTQPLTLRGGSRLRDAAVEGDGEVDAVLAPRVLEEAVR